MSGKTGIQWTDETWNPVVGCDYVSGGCRYCYAANFHNTRMYLPWKRGAFPNAPAQYHQPFWGPKGGPQLIVSRLTDPLHWRKPRRVFVNSVSDLFHEAVPDEFIAQVFAVMAGTPRHTYQVLTKRPARMCAFVNSMTAEKLAFPTVTGSYGYLGRWTWPLPNVWLGVSVENQQAADERIPLLLQTPAAVRFLSCEPLLGPVDLMSRHFSVTDHNGEPSGPRCDPDGSPAIKWCIIGGESGRHARRFDLDWPRSLLEQCAEAGVAAFVKQLGSYWASDDEWCRAHRDSHGGQMEAWPADLQVREFPQTAREAVTA